MIKSKIYLDNEDHIFSILLNYNGSTWQVPPEYNVLRDHIDNGNGIRDTKRFYDNIITIGKLRGGDGFNLIYNYVRKVLKKRLPLEVEGNLYSVLWKGYRQSKVGYKYAKYVVRGKLPVEFEVGCSSYEYVLFLMTKKLEYENVLLGNSRLSYTFYRCQYFLPPNVHNSMIASQMIGDNAARSYFKQRRKDDRIIKNRLSIMDNSKTIREVLESLN